MMRNACGMLAFVALLVSGFGCTSQDSSTVDSAAASQESAAVSNPEAPDNGNSDSPVATPISNQQKRGDWPFWRGPNRNGIAAAGQNLPVKWSATENVAWKASIPGRGHSSPTILGERIYLATADEKQQVQSVICLDRNNGRKLWTTQVSSGGFPKKNHPKNTSATCTVACDGERLMVCFFNHGGIQVTALDLDGEQLWQRVVGPFAPKQYKYGYAASPAIYGSLVIVAADYDRGGYLVGLNRKTGEEVWKVSRPAKLSYSSPIVANVAGRDQLLISGCEMVAAYEPNTGKKRWSVNATAMATCGTMVWDNGLMFASGGYPKAETVCVKADGSGEIVWKNNRKCYEQSILAYDGYVYAATDAGIVYCWKGSDGSTAWQGRVTSPISASPILAGGNIYLSNERGKTYVFRATPEKFDIVAENQLGDEAFATPVICSDRLYLRVADHSSGARKETLYCIGSASH